MDHKRFPRLMTSVFLWFLLPVTHSMSALFTKPFKTEYKLKKKDEKVGRKKSGSPSKEIFQKCKVHNGTKHGIIHNQSEV